MLSLIYANELPISYQASKFTRFCWWHNSCCARRLKLSRDFYRHSDGWVVCCESITSELRRNTSYCFCLTRTRWSDRKRRTGKIPGCLVNLCFKWISTLRVPISEWERTSSLFSAPWTAGPPVFWKQLLLLGSLYDDIWLHGVIVTHMKNFCRVGIQELQGGHHWFACSKFFAMFILENFIYLKDNFTKYTNITQEIEMTSLYSTVDSNAFKMTLVI